MAIRVGWNPVDASGFTKGGTALGGMLANIPANVQSMIKHRLENADLKRQHDLRMREEGFWKTSNYDMSTPQGMMSAAEGAQGAGLTELSAKLRDQSLKATTAQAALESAKKRSGLDALYGSMVDAYGQEEGMKKFLEALKASKSWDRTVTPGSAQAKVTPMGYNLVRAKLKNTDVYKGLGTDDSRAYGAAVTERIAQLQAEAANSRTGIVPENAALYAQAQQELMPYMEQNTPTGFAPIDKLWRWGPGADLVFNQDAYAKDRNAIQTTMQANPGVPEQDIINELRLKKVIR